jgi:hypothetical protein
MNARFRLGTGLVATVALALAATPAGAHPPSRAVYVPPPQMREAQSAKPVTNVVHLSKPSAPHVTIPVYPIYLPVVLPAFGAGLFGATGYGGMFGAANPCSAQSQPKTLGELAPGGDASFAPVTQSMLPSQPSGGVGSWLSAIVGIPSSSQGSPLLGQPTFGTDAMGLQSMVSQCASPSTLMPSVDLGN